MARFLLVGEGMIELSAEGDLWRMGHAGDTLNTAIHLARLGNTVAYCTALGSDPFSARLLDAWKLEGLDVSLVLTAPDRMPGLYAIRTDDAGERTFSYWRSASAARLLFQLPGIEAVQRAAVTADMFGFSLISLAILSPADREKLLDLARGVRKHGGLVAFDGNYRPALWGSVAEAIKARDAAIACCDIGLPTLEDEIALAGPQSVAEVQAHWAGLGARETVVKLGADGCLVAGQVVPPRRRIVPVDTSGAGDAFNAGYLDARLRGASGIAAAEAGHAIAAWVIQRPGATPPVSADAPYDAPAG